MTDYSKNIDSLQLALGPDTTLLLRTAPVSTKSLDDGFVNLLESNAAIRLLGAAKRIGVIDWAAMVQVRMEFKLLSPDARTRLALLHSLCTTKRCFLIIFM